MKIFSAYFHQNGFIVQAEKNEDFWVLLSRSLGWEKFCKIDDMEAITGRASRFESREIRLANEPAPYPVISGSNVLWHLLKACEVLKTT